MSFLLAEQEKDCTVMEPHDPSDSLFERLAPEEGANLLLHYGRQHFLLVDSEQQAALSLARGLGGFFARAPSSRGLPPRDR